MNKSHKYILILIICIAYLLRVYGLNWDQGFNLHPDERAILMFTNDLKLPTSLSEFFSPTSPLNPQFFAYGNFPLYLLKITSVITSWFDSTLGTYDRMALVGRVISAIADLGTLIVVFFIAKKLFNVRIGLFSAAIYAISVFPIQASHFYAVDVLLTFFCSLTLYFILCLTKKTTKHFAVLAGTSFGFALATKISALVLGVPFGIFIILSLISAYHTYKKNKSFAPLKNLSICIVYFSIMTLGVFIVTQPYAIIDWQTFLQQTIEQSRMTHDVFTFPYTMQYYGKVSYIYELKNIFMWGLGPVISVLSVLGFLLFITRINRNKLHFRLSLVMLSFVVVYFLIVGNFAVGWMRYMLPLYPYFAIFAGIAVYAIIKALQTHKMLYPLACCLLAIAIAYWPMSFIQIYGTQHPRITATNWIHNSIPTGSTIATEHWDDRLPLTQSELYNFVELPMYDPESEEKWKMIEGRLVYADYIILSSNRLYTPLQKLTDCKSLPEGRCYPQSAKFYNELFSGSSDFKKVAEFTNYPRIPIFGWEINDQSADESFTVYDHPKVIIFEKIITHD